jgi:hypothetical protein
MRFDQPAQIAYAVNVPPDCSTRQPVGVWPLVANAAPKAGAEAKTIWVEL